jgi:uncharacterized protein (DUF2062 family)
MPRKFLRRFLPHPHRVREHRLLAWLGPALHHHHLWHVSREGIARGVAIGGFFGFLIPVGQIPAAAIFCVLLRANIPVAIIGTFVTNAFTFAPIYYAAYRLGLFLMGADTAEAATLAAFDASAQDVVGWFRFWYERLLEFGKPLFIGLAAMACAFAIASYFLINWAWRFVTVRAWRGRSWGKRKRAAGTPDPSRD